MAAILLFSLLILSSLNFSILFSFPNPPPFLSLLATPLTSSSINGREYLPLHCHYPIKSQRRSFSPSSPPPLLPPPGHFVEYLAHDIDSVAGVVHSDEGVEDVGIHVVSEQEDTTVELGALAEEEVDVNVAIDGGDLGGGLEEERKGEVGDGDRKEREGVGFGKEKMVVV